MDALCKFTDAILGFLYHVAPSLVTVGLGGYVVNRFFVRKANLATLVERVCNCVDQLRNDAADYWSTDYSESKKAELAVLEAKIKAGILQINEMVRSIPVKYPGSADEVDKMKIEVLNLQDFCTGGNFESTRRMADKGRFMKIVRSIGRLTVSLQNLKI